VNTWGKRFPFQFFQKKKKKEKIINSLISEKKGESLMAEAESFFKKETRERRGERKRGERE